MPMLAVEIPIYSSSPSSGKRSLSRSITPAEPQRQGRQYGNGPLPVKLSDTALADARIVGRVIDVRGAFYSLKIGDVEVNEVGVDEILDYVSALDLEEYETKEFEEEAELIRIAEVEAEQRKREKQARRKELARTKGIVIEQSDDSEDDDDAVSEDAADVATGKHGRARPDYKQFYLKPELKPQEPQPKRRRRKRDPQTGELLPLDDDENINAQSSESSEDNSQPTMVQGQAGSSDQVKRRRRRRNPATGELMPLGQTDAAHNVLAGDKKRRRRRRHPRTGELMPYGWKYDPNAPEEMVPQSSTSNPRVAGVGAMSPALHRLSISHEHEPKRMKLDGQSSSGQSPFARVQIPSSARESTSAEEESEDELGPAHVLSTTKSPPKPIPSASRGQLGIPAALQPATTSAVLESSPEPTNSMMSILQPAGGPSAIDTPEDEDDELAEGEWVIEGILSHHMSDPRTHEPELGKKPVMLYQVKWEGWDEPTWEPMESFPDRSVVEDYKRQISDENGVKPAKRAGFKQGSMSVPSESSDPLSRSTRLPSQQQQPLSHAQQSQRATFQTKSAKDAEVDASNEEESEEEGSYTIEHIVDHMLSDPRTHSSELAREPVMLYKVKWKGYQGFTWEPIDSFDHWSDVNRYRQRVGLPLLRQEDHEDEDDNDDDSDDDDIN